GAIRLVALAEYELLDTGAGHKLPNARVFQLSAKGDKPKLYQHVFDVHQKDSVVQLDIQAPVVTVEDAAHMRLLQQILQKKFIDLSSVDLLSVDPSSVDPSSISAASPEVPSVEVPSAEEQAGDFTSVFPLAFHELEGIVFVIQSAAFDEQQL